MSCHRHSSITEVQQIDQGAAQAIDRPGCDHVDVTPGDRLQQGLDGRDMDEHVLAATAVGLDETVTLGRIEPLHCTAWHCRLRSEPEWLKVNSTIGYGAIENQCSDLKG
jgi:hypothetical protein